MSLQQDAGVAGFDAARRRCRADPPLVAAYREGLGLAAVAVICAAAGRVQINAAADAKAADMRFWCRRLSDAERVAAAATARWRSADEGGAAPTFSMACESITHAARRLNVSLRSDEDIDAEAAAIIARVAEEIERLQRSGELKSINKAYRTYRIETSGRGERVLRYADWMSKYKEKLVRELAAALKYV